MSHLNSHLNWGVGIKANLWWTKGLQLMDSSAARFISDSKKSDISVSWHKWLPQLTESSEGFVRFQENVTKTSDDSFSCQTDLSDFLGI